MQKHLAKEGKRHAKIIGEEKIVYNAFEPNHQTQVLWPWSDGATARVPPQPSTHTTTTTKKPFSQTILGLLSSVAAGGLVVVSALGLMKLLMPLLGGFGLFGGKSKQSQARKEKKAKVEKKDIRVSGIIVFTPSSSSQ